MGITNKCVQGALMRTAERRVEGIWVSYKVSIAQPNDLLPDGNGRLCYMKLVD